MRSYRDSGDGDLCPVEGHGRMIMNRDRTGQWCPVQTHDRTGGAFFGYDGTTPRTERTVQRPVERTSERPVEQTLVDPFHGDPTAARRERRRLYREARRALDK